MGIDLVAADVGTGLTESTATAASPQVGAPLDACVRHLLVPRSSSPTRTGCSLSSIEQTYVSPSTMAKTSQRRPCSLNVCMA